jgi:sugar lactone lactonase YvrE
VHWVDIRAGVVHRWSPADGSDRLLQTGQPVGSLALGADGGLVLALRDGFALIPAGADQVERLVPVEQELSGTRMNDGRCDPAGRFWAGTMSSDNVPGLGSLYRLDHTSGTFRTQRILGGLSVANGIDWSPDGRRMYYVDSPTQRIDVFDFAMESGEASNRRAFVEIPAAEGLPDGMFVDAEGGIWVALFRAGRMRRYSPDGRMTHEIEVPVTLVTSAAFGGPDFADLYITTARHRLTPEQRLEQTHAGSVFCCRPGVVGRPSFRFRGV